MRKQLACPVCGFKRLVDADENTKSELCEETQIKNGWRPDYYAKCKKCGKQIGKKSRLKYLVQSTMRFDIRA